jgi:phospholipid/cholesterol/gamma-HCH transport system substrate-binding protein
MNERRMQFRVGVAVFFTVIATAILTAVNEPLPSGWLPWGKSSYRIGIKVPRAPGVGPNTPVRKNGLLIGRIETIEDQEDGVVLYADVETDRPLQTNHVPHVRTTMLGDATVDFLTSPSTVAPQPLADGAVVPGQVDDNPLESLGRLGDLQQEFGRAAESLDIAGKEVSKLAQTINEAFDDETDKGRVSRLLDTTEVAMANFASTMAAMNEIIGDVPPDGARPAVTPRPVNQQPLNQRPLNQQLPLNQQPTLTQPPVGQAPTEGQQMRRRIREGLNQLPEAIGDARDTMREYRETLELADKNLKNLEGFTEPLGARGEEIASTLIQAIQGLDTLVKDFTSLTQALNNREGTVGRLIHDGQVYDNLNRLMCNANTVLAQINDLTLRLKPVVNDARVFMDKIAREPGRIVTGGINPSLTK